MITRGPRAVARPYSRENELKRFTPCFCLATQLGPRRQFATTAEFQDFVFELKKVLPEGGPSAGWLDPRKCVAADANSGPPQAITEESTRPSQKGYILALVALMELLGFLYIANITSRVCAKVRKTSINQPTTDRPGIIIVISRNPLCCPIKKGENGNNKNTKTILWGACLPIVANETPMETPKLFPPVRSELKRHGQQGILRVRRVSHVANSRSIRAYPALLGFAGLRSCLYSTGQAISLLIANGEDEEQSRRALIRKLEPGSKANLFHAETLKIMKPEGLLLK